MFMTDPFLPLQMCPTHKMTTLQFPNPPKHFIKELDIVHVLCANGDSYIFKPDKPESYEREAHIAECEMAVYQRFKHLQGTCIPICYGVGTLHPGGETGLLIQDCGTRTFEYPPQDENSKFILYMRAVFIMSKCLDAGFVHEDMEFRNIVYDPQTLQVRMVDVEPVRYAKYTAVDMWKFLDLGFIDEFGYDRPTFCISWAF